MTAWREAILNLFNELCVICVVGGCHSNVVEGCCTFGEGKQRSNYHAVCVVGASECACMSSAVLYVRIVSYSISLSTAEMCAMSGLRDKASGPLCHLPGLWDIEWSHRSVLSFNRKIRGLANWPQVSIFEDTQEQLVVRGDKDVFAT